MSAFTDVLANIIRTVDGKHDLGAGELAERIEVELAKAGIAITQLPEAVTAPSGALVFGHGTEMYRGEVIDGDGNRFDATLARENAACLLAAAASIPTKETPNA